MFSHLFLIEVFLLGSVLTDSDEKCLLDRLKVTKNISTKTPYHYVRSNSSSQKGSKTETSETSQLWLIARHGTRYPSNAGLDAIKTKLPKLAEKIKENHSKGRGNFCKDDLKFITDWIRQTSDSLKDNKIEEKNLHPEGEMEHILLAERFREKFPGLLPTKYSPESFTFRATKTERAQKSQFYFATGLFDRKVVQQEVLFEKPVEPQDPLIRFYKTCLKWLYEVKKSPISVQEFEKFQNSDFFLENLVAPVSLRLGFKENLSLSDIQTLYVSCNFLQAWHPNKGVPTCQFFSENELQILEYLEELEYYWQDGYGFDINYKPGCVLIKDIIENFELVKKGTSTKKGVFYFTHSGTILKFLSFLGLFRDSDHLTSDNFNAMKNDRLFRTSRIDPFGSNIAFVLTKEFKVGMYHNENLIQIPGCDVIWCPLEEFKNIFIERVNDCDLDKICATDKISNDPNAAADDRF